MRYFLYHQVSWPARKHQVNGMFASIRSLSKQNQYVGRLLDLAVRHKGLLWNHAAFDIYYILRKPVFFPATKRVPQISPE
jgi:hypothetical protein